MESMNWLRDGEVMALGWTLLHFCWQGTVIAMLYVMVDRAAGNASRNTRYGISFATLAAMPFVAVMTFLKQERLWILMPSSGHESYASKLAISMTPLSAQSLLLPRRFNEASFGLLSNADQLLPWIVGFWLAGVLFLALRAAGGWWRLEQIRASSIIAIPVEVESSFHRVTAHLRIGRKIALYISDEVISPMAMGVWRTAIILPMSAAVQLSPEQLEAVLAHEIEHIRRCDYLCNVLQTIVECLLFFHPAVWWVSRRTRDLRELCCDEVAARNCADPKIYVEALLQLESQRTKRPQLAMALRGHKGSLLQRVKQLLGEEIIAERETMYGARFVVVGVVVLALILGSLMAKGFRPIDQGTSSPAGQVSLNTASKASRHASSDATLEEKRPASHTFVHLADAYRPGIVRVLWEGSETTGFVAKSVNGRATIVTATYGSPGPFRVETWNHQLYPARIQKAGEIAFLEIDAPNLKALKPSKLSPDAGMAITGIGFGASNDLRVHVGKIRSVTGNILKAGYDGVHAVLPGFGGSPILDPSGNVVGIAYAFDRGNGNHIIQRYESPE
jgi:beta-lactamase regulating signal transducer with metallopeptidase domain